MVVFDPATCVTFVCCPPDIGVHDMCECREPISLTVIDTSSEMNRLIPTQIDHNLVLRFLLYKKKKKISKHRDRTVPS